MPFIQKIKKIDWIILVAFFINVALVTYYFSLNTDFHVDEYFTFGHSNSPKAPLLVEGIDFSLDLPLMNKTIFANSNPRCLDADIGHKYLTVQENERFNYVVQVDHHPPLYYFMIHTISSFFPEIFSLWLGFPINIVFFILTFFVLYKFAQDVFGDKTKACLTVIFWGFCMTTLNMSVFIRSYMMQMFVGTVLLYEHYKLLQQEKVKFANLFKIFLFSYLGFMSHFYFLIFSFLCAAIVCLYFLWHKRIRDLFIYAGAILLSVVLFFVSFPLAIDILFNSPRSVEMKEHKWNDYYFYHISLARLLEFIMTYIFAFDNSYSHLFVFVLLCVLGVVIAQNEKKKMPLNIKFLIICTVLFLGFIALVVPNDIGKWYDRYFAPIVPMLCLLMVYYFVLFLKAFYVSDKFINIVLAICVLLNAFCTNWQAKSAYSMQLEKDTQVVLEKLNGKNILFLTNMWLEVVSFVADYSLFKSVCVFNQDDKDKVLPQIQWEKYDYFIVFQKVDDDLKEKTQSDYVAKNIDYKNLTFVQTFKKGMYLYELYKIDSAKNE